MNLIMINCNNISEKNYNTQLHYMDTDSFALGVNKKDIFEDFKKLADLFDFSNLSENRELFTNKTRKGLENLK